MTTVVRPLNYSGTVQRLVVTSAIAGQISCELWGGGGGGGGNDYPGTGGWGSGGGYARKTFNAVAGDVIDVAVGGFGGTGYSYRPIIGGSGGASWVPNTLIFNSLTPPTDQGQDPVYQVTNRSYCGFLNTYGVWGDPGGYAASFNRNYWVNFPVTGDYQFIGSVDNYGSVFLDGNSVLEIGGFGTTWSNTISVTAGTHQITLGGYNYGGPGSFGLTVTLLSGYVGYSGAPGGYAGGAGASGSGAGGGGATVVFLNGSVIAVAGGGGGGGGGGHVGAAYGQNAPGPYGRAAVGINAGEGGQSNLGDGGGGGGGGGGYGGGNGGLIPGGDQGGYAGSAGGSTGDFTVDPVNQNPAYPCPYGNAGRGGPNGGGNGTNGLAAFTFTIPGLYVKNNSAWNPVQTTYVKQSGVWSPVKEIYVKNGGQWVSVAGAQDEAPNFTSIGNANFGVSARPGYQPPDYGGGGDPTPGP